MIYNLFIFKTFYTFLSIINYLLIIINNYKLTYYKCKVETSRNTLFII